MKIVVVDEDSRIKNLVVNALSYCVNRRVTAFTSAMEAWNYLENGGSADIIISGAKNAWMDGFELMTRVKRAQPETIFILMSGAKSHEIQAKSLGADAFLSIPFGVNDLFNIVQTYIVD